MWDTIAEAIPQWETKYFSQILPFVMPYMASGPDYHPHQRWRRNFEGVPFVSPEVFAATFGRRVEWQCRADRAALPIIRSIAFQWKAEHTMALPMRLYGVSGAATKTASKVFTDAAQSLYAKLRTGFMRTGAHRIPIAGDMTK